MDRNGKIIGGCIAVDLWTTDLDGRNYSGSIFNLASNTKDNIVIAPANTGNDNNKRIAVIKTAQANKGIRSNNIPNTRKFPNVLIKFTAPKIDLTPAKCKEKIAKSTDLPA